ncbi:MAG: hypothetical protein J0I19_12065 [Alphaproteobacteria bacterium]|nr:hypothetical protein [Alphaproteobacteria bacterium]
MTLLISFITPDRIWLCADRRLTSSRGMILSDDAVKLFCLETMDGIALLGYAGLGATANGTQPSEWMSNVLRGRGFNLYPSLQCLANAMYQQLPPHLAALSPNNDNGHVVLTPAFLNGAPKIFAIERAIAADRSVTSYQIIEAARSVISGDIPPTFGFAGSGAGVATRLNGWKRSVQKLAERVQKGLLSPEVVADALAAVNFKVSKSVNSVGPNCIVVWREKSRGGAHASYRGELKEHSNNYPSIPTIAAGRDVNAIGRHFMSRFLGPDGNLLPNSVIEKLMASPIDVEEENAKLAKLPSDPDETLK